MSESLPLASRAGAVRWLTLRPPVATFGRCNVHSIAGRGRRVLGQPGGAAVILPPCCIERPARGVRAANSPLENDRLRSALDLHPSHGRRIVGGVDVRSHKAKFDLPSGPRAPVPLKRRLLTARADGLTASIR